MRRLVPQEAHSLSLSLLLTSITRSKCRLIVRGVPHGELRRPVGGERTYTLETHAAARSPGRLKTPGVVAASLFSTSPYTHSRSLYLSRARFGSLARTRGFHVCERERYILLLLRRYGAAFFSLDFFLFSSIVCFILLNQLSRAFFLFS